MQSQLNELHQALLEAHAKHDHGKLVTLYTQAGQKAENASDIDAACFYYTHAYVFALESGHRDVADLKAKLKSHGREE